MLAIDGTEVVNRELGLAIGFGVSGNQGHYDTAAILEWVVALVYTFYVLSFFMDFIPAVRTKGQQSHETEEQMATREASMGYDGATLGREDDYTPGRHYANNTSNGYGNGHTALSYDTAAAPYTNGATYPNGAKPNHAF